MKIAILDLGTNTFHLIIAEVNKGGLWKAILKKRITVKLGKGGIHNNIIGEQAYSRGLKALKKFHASISRVKVRKVYAFGTAAFRSAENGKQFLTDAKIRYNLDIKVISGTKEAALIYLGVKQAVKLDTKPALIMDIGGGSVEMIIANTQRIFWKQSFRIGAALLLEKFAPSDPLRRKDIHDILRHIDQSLTPFLLAVRKFRPQQIVGSAGSFETFASMIRHRFPGSQSHYGKTEHQLSIAHFKHLYRELIVSDTNSRNQMKGLIKMRVDMIVMAALLLNFVIDTTKIREMKLSAYSLKEGALLNTISNLK